MCINCADAQLYYLFAFLLTQWSDICPEKCQQPILPFDRNLNIYFLLFQLFSKCCIIQSFVRKTMRFIHLQLVCKYFNKPKLNMNNNKIIEAFYMPVGRYVYLCFSLFSNENEATKTKIEKPIKYAFCFYVGTFRIKNQTFNAR